MPGQQTEQVRGSATPAADANYVRQFKLGSSSRKHRRSDCTDRVVEGLRFRSSASTGQIPFFDHAAATLFQKGERLSLLLRCVRRRLAIVVITSGNKALTASPPRVSSCKSTFRLKFVSDLATTAMRFQ